MTDFLFYLVLFMGLIVALGFFNERVTRLTYEIALMLFSLIIGVVFALISGAAPGGDAAKLLDAVLSFDFSDFLMKGVLCFMLFSGSCHMRLRDFREQKQQIAVLSILATLFGAIFYGVLFYLISLALHLGFTMPMCLMFGSIVAPTDPIAATSILSKFGLPKKTGFLIEGESLLNDGVGVALFTVFSGMVRAAGKNNFFLVMLREILGAVAVGTGVTLLCFLLFYFTKDTTRQIFVSILAVAASYLLCELWDFSGAIACVVCGVLFSSLTAWTENRGKSWELQNYDTFWSILDDLLNSVLYVIMGLTFVRALGMTDAILLGVLSIAANLIARGGSLFFSTFVMGSIPDQFSRWNFIKLLTWGGLRGGLCIALAMSTQTMLPEDTYRIVLGATYVIVAFTTIVQGLSMPKVYRGIQKAEVNSNDI